MAHKPLTIEELREKIQKGEGKDPLVFLESVMNGQDPRRISRIYKLAVEIDDFTDGDIPRSDWNELLDAIMLYLKYDTVSMQESLTASKTLAEYLHAKRKQVELNGIDGSGENKSPAPISEEEITIFWEKYHEQGY